ECFKGMTSRPGPASDDGVGRYVLANSTHPERAPLLETVHKSHTLTPSRKHETMPSALILRTVPKRLATRAAVVRAPSARAGGDARSPPERECASWRRIAPKASSRPLESATRAP